MVKRGTWYVPTLAVYYTDWDPPDNRFRRRDRKRAAVHEVSFQKALRAGVKIAFGTDVGGFPWTQPIAQEFEREVALGMTRNPLADVKVLEQVPFIMKDGIVFRSTLGGGR